MRRLGPRSSFGFMGGVAVLFYLVVRSVRRSWVTATAITIAIDVVLRKPIGVLAQALIQTIRHEVCLPEGLYIGKGRNRMSV